MAIDKNGSSVQYGDYVAVSKLLYKNSEFAGIVRIVKMSESPKGTRAIGAFPELSGNGRIGKVGFDPANSVLVLRSDGSDPNAAVLG